MLTANEYLNIEDYAFKSSPESCSGNSCFTDCTDLPSDEDFLQQLSSDLDIPLLLNANDDDMSLLNSFFDKSPDEIMSEIVSPGTPNSRFDDIAESFGDFDHKPDPGLCSEIKIEQSDSYSSSSSNKSHSPVQSPEDSIKFFEIKDEMKNEPHSPGAVAVPVHCTDVDSNIIITTIANSHVKFISNPITTIAKKVPIQPKITSTPKNKVVLKNADYKRSAGTPIGTKIVSPPPQKVVVLENLTTVPIASVAQIPASTLNNSGISNTAPPVIVKGRNLALNVGNIDPRILKRHQRKIKNRESACLSRKKKKDYLTSLEMQVKELMTENQHLKLENKQLKERLVKYEGVPSVGQKSPNNVKTTVVLCMFLFSMAFNFDYVRSPWLAKSPTNLIEVESPKILEHHGRTLLWAPDILDNNGSSFLPFSMCPALINQTESARLALELERWIGKPKPLVDKVTMPNVTRVAVAANKPKSLRKRKLKTPLFSSVYDDHSVGKKLLGQPNKELQVFAPAGDQRYSEFFEAINRQDDTFYVVSFSDLHMLLPALHHNKTRRPKMSLIMPSVLPSENGTQPTLVPLMQIDCEVVDTRLIQVKYGSIPRHLRRHGNSTYQENESVGKQDESTAHYSGRKAYKPYFIKHQTVRSTPERDLYNVR